MMNDNNKTKDSSKKNKEIKEIEVEQKDLLNVFFDKSTSQFESQLFLSRKRMLNAENGQNELSDLLKSKLKALDMMLLILSNNKNIIKESDLSCCEVLNNLLSISKNDKSYGEHIYSKIKSIILYILKNQLSLKEKNNDTSKVIIKFLITLLNIKFDNGYFKQVLEIISSNQDMFTLFLNELFHKLFKGRNITIKIKEMKYILKTILFDDKIKKYMNYFDLMEKIISYAHEKGQGGCRTSFQLNQVAYLLQYLLDILNIKEIKSALPEKDEINKRLLKILNDFKNSIEELVDKNDYEFDKSKISKKNLEAKNDIIKRKKTFFGEMLNYLNKLKNNFKDELGEKESTKVIGDINNLYKNVINTKYIVVANTNNTNTNNKNDKNKNKKDNNNDNKTKKEKEKDKNKNKGKENDIKDKDEENEIEEDDKNKKEEEEEEEKEEKEEDEEEEDNKCNIEEEGKKNDIIDLDEEKEEIEKKEKENKKKNKKGKLENKKGNKNKNTQNDNDNKKENKNKKKKHH